MSTNKRQKLEAEEQLQCQSAFARLRNLRSQPVPSPPAPAVIAPKLAPQKQSSNVTAETNNPHIVTPKRPKRGRFAQATLDAQQDALPNESPRPAAGGPSTPYAILSKPDSAIENTPPPQAANPTQLSNFHPNRSNFKEKTGGKVQIKLTGGERLVILGSYGITLSSGEVTLYGAALRPSTKTHWVHAPHCHALPVIRCPEEAVIELAPHPTATGLAKLGSLSPLFRRLWNDHSVLNGSKFDGPTFSILYTSADGPKRVLLCDLKSPPEWNREISRLTAASRARPCSVIVTGPKSAGKSTFAKLLINQLLTEKVDKKKSGRNNNNNCVAVLDLDPGQPEFGPPGQVSLVQVTEPIFSPSFCRPLLSIGHGSDTHIIRSHTLASVTPASDPELYLAAITDLITHYRNRIGSLPLVVNTPGWVQGTGLDLLTSLIESIRPSHVLYMASGPLDVIESLQASFKHGEITILPSQTTQYTTRTAAQLRAMQVMSYFHSETSTERQEWNTEPLSMLPPWKVQFSGAVSGILGVICYDYQAPPNVLADAINGTVLALVEVESPVALSTENKDQTPISSWKAIETDAIAATPEGVPYIQPGWALNPKHSQTIGLALLRGIDVANRSLQLLTPVSDERIRQINEKGGRIVLVSGKFDPPSWAYTEDLYRQSLNTTDEGDNEDVDEEMDIIDEDEAVDSEHEPHQEDLETASAPTPWIEVLRGNQKRGTASRVWRVRRDLGRNNAN